MFAKISSAAAQEQGATAVGSRASEFSACLTAEVTQGTAFAHSINLSLE